MKIKNLVIFIITIVFVLIMAGYVNATADYATIIRGNDNQWIQFPSIIKKSWTTNWDGYYTYSGTINKISTSENITFQIQYLCIERTEVDKIQEKSDQTSEDSEFNQWLNNWAADLISEENWTDFTNMQIDIECKLGDKVQHEHLVLVKVIDNDSESLAWQGYGDGFSRVNESRKKVNLESIEITTQPTKVNYTIGEKFDNTGMVVTAKYSDGASKVVTDYTYTPQEELKITDTVITIVYSEKGISKEASQEITVVESDNEDDDEINFDNEDVVLESIEITTPPTKTDYVEGEVFDCTGMVITAKYSDGSTKVVTDYTYTPDEELELDNTIITILYSENDISKEANQKIKVTEREDIEEDLELDTEEETEEDTTITDGELPHTGEKKKIIFAIISVIVVGMVSYLRYIRIKDIV